MADQLEGARTIPVKFRDRGDGSVAEIIEVRNVDPTGLVVDSTPATRSALPGASGAVTAVPGRLLGFSIRETAGGAATFRLRDGGAAGGILDTVSLAAGESLREWFGPAGKAVVTSVYYEKISGTLEGAVFTR